MELTASDLALATGGVVVAGDGGARASSLANDSRTLAPGACFVALVAARDRHDFVADAFVRGATIALVTRAVTRVAVPAHGAVVRVRDTMDALAALGTYARSRLQDPIVVGITGSTGKTTT